MERMATDFHDRTDEQRQVWREAIAQAVGRDPVECDRAARMAMAGAEERERVHAERNAEHTAKLKEAVAKMKAEQNWGVSNVSMRQAQEQAMNAEYRAYLEAWGLSYPTVQQQTDTHLAALDAALGVAVQNVKRDARFQLRKTSQGRWALLGPAAFYDETHCREYMEAITAFLYGDLALALQKRDEFIATFEVAP